MEVKYVGTEGVQFKFTNIVKSLWLPNSSTRNNIYMFQKHLKKC